ncbi:MAG: 3-phosphoshikimate 1-carboxyvinyltransferase [Dehalococcoidales bacterium]|nr:3-phosphoshikimate 1-carboxyvinyltransferase [Dehalococcoidales bacterium]
MKVSVKKSEVKGKVAVPASKSMTIRALTCAALSRGNSEIVHPLVSDDTNAAADVLGKIGVSIDKEKDLWRVTGGSLRVPREELFCGESATTLRFMMAVCSLIPGKHTLYGGPSLSKRPVKSLVEALRKLGIKGSMEGKTTPPVTIEGGTLKGDLTELPGNISSQFISALLLIAPFAKKEIKIGLTTPMTSRPYVLMTLWCMKKFGINVRTEFDKFVVRRQAYKPTRLEIEGDWSSASYFLALGAVSEGVTVENLNTSSLQGDRVILDFLRGMGAKVRLAGNTITVSEGNLRALHADLSDCIDLLPTVAALAALAEGTSLFTGIERARIKESNRVAAVKEGLERLGVTVTEGQDSLTIVGLKTTKPKEDDEDGEETKEGEAGEEKAEEEAAQEREPVLIDSHGDHRIAMAFGVLGAAFGGIIVDGAECVAKTFPDFWEVLKSAGGELEIDAE